MTSEGFVKLIAVLAAAAVLSACATAPDQAENRSSAGTVPEQLNSVQEKLVEAAYSMLGREELIVENRKFALDCSGVVLALYWYAGIDLTKAYADYTGNGVSRIYNYLKDNELLYRTLYPAPGDIIFWDNTYDKNGDGKPNDLLTHVGMVVTSDSKGNIEYVHHNYRKGIILEKMNLTNPDTYSETVDGSRIIVNSAMRMRGSPEFSKWLSSQLYRQFGMGYLLE